MELHLNIHWTSCEVSCTSSSDTILHRQADGQIKNSLAILARIQDSFSDQLITSFEKLLVSNFEAYQTKSLKSKEAEMTQMRIGERRQTDASVRSLPPYTVQDSCQQQEPSATVKPSSFKKKYDCRPGCTCSCHITRGFNSPFFISTILGELSLEFRSQRAGVTCNCSGHQGVALIYRFPRYLLQRYISLIIQTTFLDGPEFLLRVPRVLPWTHLLWRYSVCGDLMAIRRMYADRLASPFDVDPAGRNALLYASKQESAEVAQFLLTEGVATDQLDGQGRPPSEALLRRSFGGVYGTLGPAITRQVLRDEDDEFTEFGFTDLHKIILGFSHKDMRALLALTTDAVNLPDSLGRTPLFWAVITDDAPTVSLLLTHSATPNHRDNRGFTALDFVRSAPIATLLLDAGAKNNVNHKNWQHSSLHEHVIENADADTIAVFAAHDFDIDIRDHDHETPLLNVIYAGNIPAAATLISLGADVNAANVSSRDSALHFAAHFDRPQILKMLLEKGADYTVLECNGRSVAHCAARSGSTELVHVMKGFGMKGVDLELMDCEGRTAGEYMMEREVLADCEVGVHEAWEEFVESLKEGEGLRREERVLGARVGVAQMVEQMEDEKEDWGGKVPGAFPMPVVRVQEVF